MSNLCIRWERIANEILMSIRAEKKMANEISLNEPMGCDKDGNEISVGDRLGSEPDAIHDEVALKMASEGIRELIRETLTDRPLPSLSTSSASERLRSPADFRLARKCISISFAILS